jgi:hypothetical protein
MSGKNHCGQCGEKGHNKTTCPNTKHCGNCGEAGHNKRSCGAKPAKAACKGRECDYSCSVCGKAGHNKTTCSALKKALAVVAASGGATASAASAATASGASDPVKDFIRSIKKMSETDQRSAMATLYNSANWE